MAGLDDRPAPFSGIFIVLHVVTAMTAKLAQIEEQRALSAGEAAQLDALARLERGLRIVLPDAFHRTHLLRTRPHLLALFEQAEAATRRGKPAIELLGIGPMLPRGRAWRQFPLTLDRLAWLGVSWLADALRRVAHQSPMALVRARQLDVVSSLQRDLLRMAELATDDARLPALALRVQDGFDAAAKSIGEDAEAIFAEAAAIRRGR